VEVARAVNDNAFFRPAGPDIVYDAIDDGIVIVNLAAGAYFTLEGVARETWELLVAGRSYAEIVAVLATRYEGEPRQIHESVAGFLDRLSAESLIVAGVGTPPEPSGPPDRTEKRPFVAPVLVAYTDLEDLLTLDPIHEVDDNGWPHSKSEKSPR
jgi:hypothetical protein